MDFQYEKKCTDIVLKDVFFSLSGKFRSRLIERILSFIPVFVGLTLFCSSLGLSYEASRPKIESQVVFLYYADLEEANHFYESIMGFQKTFSLSWVKIYRTSEDSSIGIVDEKRGFLRTSEEKPVMLSWVTDNVEGWFQYLEEKGVTMMSPLGENQEAGIRSFVFSDPGGYALEFFQWLDR